MHRVAVTGVAGPIGQRLARLLEASGVEHVIGIDPVPSQVRTRAVEWVPADVATVDLKPLLAGVETVVHLAWDVAPLRTFDEHHPNHANLDAVHRVLDAAAGAAVGAFVYLSSAAVYGAWPDNPVPLTEQAPLRPNPGVVDAVQHAEAERLIAEWAEEHPAVRVVILRTVPVLGADSWLTVALGSRPPVRADTSPPRQFIHVDDVASALAIAACNDLRGTYNLTPDGWIGGDVVRDLLAGWPSLPAPARLARAVARAAWALGVTRVPPALLPLVEHPWVVANDRLRAAGWEPQHTNEEALVAGSRGSRWREMSPRRRQEVALGAAAAAALGVGAGIAALVMRARRRRMNAQP